MNISQSCAAFSAAIFAVIFSNQLIAADDEQTPLDQTIPDQTISEQTISEQTIVVTANRTEQSINDTLASVVVISRLDIERLQPQSITDLLSTIPGFDFVYTGGDGQSASLFTRGSSSDHTLILVDGIRVGSASLGNKDFATIPVSQIERIEVVKGPRAALWGSDAIGGVIQIFTRRLENNQVSADLMIGSNSNKKIGVRVGFGTDDLNNTLSVSYEDSDGFDVFNDATDAFPDSEPDDDGYSRKSVALRGDYQLSNSSKLDWVYQYDKGDNSFDNAFGANENDYTNQLLNLRYGYNSTDWNSEVSIKQSRDESFSYDSRVATKIGSTFITKRNQINLLTQYRVNDALHLLAGAEGYTDDLAGSMILQFTGDFANFDDTKRTSKAVFASSIINVGKFIAELSSRYDDLDTAGSENTFNISAGYKLTDNLTFSASRAKGFKAPTFNDLYFPGFSNPELQSEVAFNTEFLLKGHWKNHSFSIVSFDNKVSQLITFVFDPVTFAFAPVNVDKANLKGHEVSYGYQSGNFSHKISASFVDAIDQSVDAFSGETSNEQLLRRAKEHYGYELTADLGNFSFYTQLNYVGRRRDNDFSSFPAQSVMLKSHTVINLGLSYQLTEYLKLNLKLSDITDSEESTVVGYNTPGRQAFLSLEYRNF